MIRQNPHRQSDIIFALLRALSTNPRTKQRALAELLGISLGSVNSHLARLVRDGMLVTEQSADGGADGSAAFSLSPSGEALKTSLAPDFIGRTRAEGERIQAELNDLRCDFPDLFPHSQA